MARLVHVAPIAGALLALPLLAAGPALARHKHHGHKGHAAQENVNSAAYPRAPGGMPAASDHGKPVMPKADPAAKPGPPAKASTEQAPAKTSVPSTAYPDAPGGTPAAGDGGKPITPKP